MIVKQKYLVYLFLIRIHSHEEITRQYNFSSWLFTLHSSLYVKDNIQFCILSMTRMVQAHKVH